MKSREVSRERTKHTTTNVENVARVENVAGVEDVEGPAAEQELRLDQVLGAKDVHEAELLQLRDLRELQEHLLLVLDAQGEEGVEVDELAQAEIVHQLVNSEGQGDGVGQVDAAQVQAAVDLHVAQVERGWVEAVVERGVSLM